MKFSTDAVPAEFPALFRRLILLTGWKPWKHRLAWLEEQARANPTMSYLLDERFGRELAFGDLRQHQKITRRYPWPPETAEQQQFYSLVAMLSRCHQRLSPTGKTRLEGMIRHSLKSDYGFAPLAFEMKIAAHLMGRGFDVDFNDMEGGRGFDYLIENDGIEIEIECKFFSGDIGRQIHSKRFHQLGTAIFPELQKFLEQRPGGRLIRIFIPARLSGNTEQQQEISDLLSQAISSQELAANSNGYEVSIDDFSLADSPFGQLSSNDVSREHLEQFLSDEFKIENKNSLLLSHREKGAILVVVESAVKDAVLKGMHNQLSYSARKQISGNRPVLFCCELADMTENQLRGLGNDGQEAIGLDYMVEYLLEHRPEIHSLIFTTQGTVRINKTGLGPTAHTSIQEIGPALQFKNPSHPLVNDPRCDFF